MCTAPFCLSQLISGSHLWRNCGRQTENEERRAGGRVGETEGGVQHTSYGEYMYILQAIDYVGHHGSATLSYSPHPSLPHPLTPSPSHHAFGTGVLPCLQPPCASSQSASQLHGATLAVEDREHRGGKVHSTSGRY